MKFIDDFLDNMNPVTFIMMIPLLPVLVIIGFAVALFGTLLAIVESLIK